MSGQDRISGTHRSAAGFCSMRAMILLPLALLAACGEKKGDQPAVVANIVDQVVTDADQVPSAGNATQPVQPAPSASSPDGAEQAAPGSAIPAALVGRWTGISDNCGDRTADLELNITPGSLIFHESVGTVKGVSSGPRGRIRVDAAFTGEGESWNRRLELHPSANGRELTIVNDGTATVRKRC